MWKIAKDVPQTAVSNGHTKLQEVNHGTPLDEIFKYLDEDGGVIIKGLLTPSEATQLREELKAPLDRVQRGSLYAGYHDGLANFHGRKTKRAGGLVNHSSIFRNRFVENDLIHAICTRVYSQDGHAGDYWLSGATTIFVEGPQEPQQLHRDSQSHPPYVELGHEGTEGTINFIIAVTPFTEANGATAVIPGSNKWPYDQFGNYEQTVPAVMDPGDVLFIGGKVIHGTGRNSTTEERGCIQVSIVPSFLTPQEASPLILDFNIVKKMSKRAQQFLGFRSQYPRGSPGLWLSDYQELALHTGVDDPSPRVNILYHDS
ncbi:PhyH-domain-containing protein [Hypoxylon trugodes]|uniref:PhyH-domain-containing protein n=1 Tax=Hypoxylon trugodes TaxID=326681 RepID=UPI002197E6BF|nr:PhyH-domain-containing protein [Hypoxylon trugodes]KAI1388528.1 PhyH-domain-containing protein [Hypoxylon trugodes]